MATINFLYRSNKERASLTLRLLFRFEGKDYVYAGDSKIMVTKDYWNNGFKEVIPKRMNSDILIHNRNVEASKNQNELKEKLLGIEYYIIDEFNKYNPSMISKDWLKTQITNYYNPKKTNIIPKDLVSFFDYYLDYRKEEMNPTLITSYKTVQKKLKDLQVYRKQTINIVDVNESFKNEFISYYKSIDHLHNTTQRAFGIVKTVCRKAKFLGLEVSHQLEGTTINPEKVESIYLDLEELKKIEESTQDNEELESAKDWLIISANCGQRFSDFMRFNIDMVRTEKNQMYIDFTQKKTNKIMSIPLNTKIVNILKKRSFQFPDKLTAHNYNRLIKKVCEKAKINNTVYGGKEIADRKVYDNYKKYELCSSHIGRRSFATNNYGIIPTSYLIYFTGHSTEEMYLRYVGKTNNDKAIEASKYFK